jgi:hypothetical protein
MPALGAHVFSRVFGNEAVLVRLERLGRDSRIFPHLVKAGFPPRQLTEASRWFAESAGSPVEFYASQNLARGFFEDESLLKLLCRYFECTDWKLENSPWFFSRDEYDRFFATLTEPVEFQTAQLEQGLGEERWGPFFHHIPFDLGMERARQALWEDIFRQEHYWKPLSVYAHVRAEALAGYLVRTVNINRFTPGRYNYHWEGIFRERFHRALRRFEQRLEEQVRLWEEVRRERRSQRLHQRGFDNMGLLSLSRELTQAFGVLGLSPARATPQSVRRAFRRLSKETHPDQGGSPEAFRRLSRSKELVEAWLTRHRPG